MPRPCLRPVPTPRAYDKLDESSNDGANNNDDLRIARRQ